MKRMQRVFIWTVMGAVVLALVGTAAFFSDYLRTQVAPLASDTGISVDGEIDTSKLQAGNHTLEVRARASSSEELSKIVSFTVLESPAPSPTGGSLPTEEPTPTAEPTLAEETPEPTPAKTLESPSELPLSEPAPLTSPPASN